MEYPTDLRLNEHRDIYIDAAGDLATIGGFEQLEQSSAIDVLDVLQEFVGGRLTGRNVGLLEERVRDALSRDEQLSEIQTVNVDEYDRGSNTVTLEIIVIGDDDFTLQLSP